MRRRGPFVILASPKSADVRLRAGRENGLNCGLNEAALGIYQSKTALVVPRPNWANRKQSRYFFQPIAPESRHFPIGTDFALPRTPTGDCTVRFRLGFFSDSDICQYSSSRLIAMTDPQREPWKAKPSWSRDRSCRAVLFVREGFDNTHVEPRGQNHGRRDSISSPVGHGSLARKHWLP
jgi:hypothetical protein